MTIVHNYFFNRGVSGSAITIPSASEPVNNYRLIEKLFSYSLYTTGLNRCQIFFN